jgi:hypothetical protein
MFFFSLGILTSRPAQAQPIYSKLSNFPRQQELWSHTINGANISQFPIATGGYIRGSRFLVTGDVLHRLPVITEAHPLNNDGSGEYAYRLWRLGDNGNYWVFLRAPSREFSKYDPGIQLAPGDYVLELPEGVDLDNLYFTNKQVVFSGYWALP